MSNNFVTRLKSAWNSFMNRDPTMHSKSIGPSYSRRPDRSLLTRGNERSIINAVYNRIAIDVASLDIKHVKLDEKGQFDHEIDSQLNNCLTLEANIDQSSRAFLHDVALSLMDEGCVAIVPVDTTSDPQKGAFDIVTMRTGQILEWYPQHIRVRVYNELTGKKEDVTMAKSAVAIVENPFYSVMNAPNSTLQRLIRKMNLIDAVDEQASAGKLNMIVQLPYAVKSDARLEQAKKRLADLENQLENNKYGVAYIDSTEKVTQVNRPLENNLLTQIEYLTKLLFSQLGLTQEILDGTANEDTMLNYFNRTIEPICSAITDEMQRKFLSKTARTRGQSIMCYRDPFKLTPVSQIAELADKFTRNEILTPNEIRKLIGMAPANDSNADELRNRNISMPNTQQGMITNQEGLSNPEEFMDDMDGMSEEELMAQYQEFQQAYEQNEADLDELEGMVNE